MQWGWRCCNGAGGDAVGLEVLQWGWRRCGGAGPHPRAPLEPPPAPGVQGCVGTRGSARQPRGSHGNGGWERLRDGGCSGEGGPRGDPRRQTPAPLPHGLPPPLRPHGSARPLRRRSSAPRLPSLQLSPRFPPPPPLRPRGADPTAPRPPVSAPPPPSPPLRPAPVAPRRHRPPSRSPRGRGAVASALGGAKAAVINLIASLAASG